MSQESSTSTCSQLSLSQETFDFMWKSVCELADNCETQIATRDLHTADQPFAVDDGDASLQIDRFQIARNSTVTSGSSQMDVDSQLLIPVDQNISLSGLGASGLLDQSFSVLQNISLNTMQPLPTFPSNLPFSGEYDFTMSLTTQSKETKAVDWTYSESLYKVFVRFSQSCPFRFHTSVTPPTGTMLRAMPIYTRPQHVQEVVKRCPHHAAKDKAENLNVSAPPSHLIRCDHKLASYTEDLYTGFHSVLVPYEHPSGDAEWTIYLYQFMCFSSCIGGLNRRPVQIVFTLEGASGHVFGRQAIEVRICACPGRDRQAEEKTNSVQPSSSVEHSDKLAVTSEILTLGPAAKRRRLDDEEQFTISIRGRENYEILHRLRDTLEVASAIPRSQFEKLRRQQEDMRKSHANSPSAPVQNNSCSNSSSSYSESCQSEPLALDSPKSSSRPVVNTDLKSEIMDNNVDNWLNQHGLSSCVSVFHQHKLFTVSQVRRLSLEDLEKLALRDDQLAIIWLAICRDCKACVPRITTGYNMPISASCPADFATTETDDNHQSGVLELTRYTFKRRLSLPKKENCQITEIY